MLQNDAYKKSMTTRAYEVYGNCERKTKVNNNTHKWRGKVDDSQLYMINYTWSTIHDQLYMINYTWSTIHDQLYMISTWKQWLYIGYIVSVDEVDIQPTYYL